MAVSSALCARVLPENGRTGGGQGHLGRGICIHARVEGGNSRASTRHGFALGCTDATSRLGHRATRAAIRSLHGHGWAAGFVLALLLHAVGTTGVVELIASLHARGRVEALPIVATIFKAIFTPFLASLLAHLVATLGSDFFAESHARHAAMVVTQVFNADGASAFGARTRQFRVVEAGFLFPHGLGKSAHTGHGSAKCKQGLFHGNFFSGVANRLPGSVGDGGVNGEA